MMRVREKGILSLLKALFYIVKRVDVKIEERRTMALP